MWTNQNCIQLKWNFSSIQLVLSYLDYSRYSLLTYSSCAWKVPCGKYICKWSISCSTPVYIHTKEGANKQKSSQGVRSGHHTLSIEPHNFMIGKPSQVVFFIALEVYMLGWWLIILSGSLRGLWKNYLKRRYKIKKIEEKNTN